MEKLAEYQIGLLWMNELAALLRTTIYNLSRKPGDITLLNDKQRLEHDIKQLDKVMKKLQPKVVAHFENAYGVKFKTLVWATNKVEAKQNNR